MRIEEGSPPNPVWQAYGEQYHVHFWRKLNDPEPPLVPLWELQEYRITEATDVERVLEWAHANADGRVIALYVEVPSAPPGPPGMVLLHGVNPTAPPR